MWENSLCVTEEWNMTQPECVCGSAEVPSGSPAALLHIHWDWTGLQWTCLEPSRRGTTGAAEWMSARCAGPVTGNWTWSYAAAHRADSSATSRPWGRMWCISTDSWLRETCCWRSRACPCPACPCTTCWLCWTTPKTPCGWKQSDKVSSGAGHATDTLFLPSTSTSAFPSWLYKHHKQPTRHDEAGDFSVPLGTICGMFLM